jgi:flagellar biosynthesis protein FlhF
LAARAALGGAKPAVITPDTVRAGGVEQLEAFTKLLQIPLHKARSATELKSRIGDTLSADITFIDTGGCNPFEVDDMRNLASLLDAGNIEPVLVMGAGGDAEESAEIARCFAVLGVQRILSTRLDIARRLGGLLAAAGRSGLAFTDFSNTPMVADGMGNLSPAQLAGLLLPPTARASTRGKTNTSSRGASSTTSPNTPPGKPAPTLAIPAKQVRRTG